MIADKFVVRRYLVTYADSLLVCCIIAARLYYTNTSTKNSYIYYSYYTISRVVRRTLVLKKKMVFETITKSCDFIFTKV